MTFKFRTRHTVFALIPFAALILLTLTNSDIDPVRNILRAQPFFLMFMAKLCMVAVLLAQHPGPHPGESWARFWQWIDPVTVILIFMFAGSGLYYFLLWSGNSERFIVSINVYHVARMLLWVDGYLSWVVSMEMISRAIDARRDRRKRHHEFYDVTEEPEGSGR